MAAISSQSPSSKPGHGCVQPAGGVRILAPGADTRSTALLLAEALRLRGGVYAAEGYCSPDALTADGLLLLPLDSESWHVLLLDRHERVYGCMRYTTEATHRPLPVRSCALTVDPVWGAPSARALQALAERAAEENITFAQAGAWVTARSARAGANAVTLVLAAFALAQVLGHCLAACTATLRHHSAAILCRLGAWPLADDGRELPSYFEPRFQCEMRLLGFDSRCPGDRYEARLAELRRVVARQLTGAGR